MKKLFSVLTIVSILFISACTKQDCEQLEVNYGEYFTIKTCGKYCFPDNNFFEVKSLRNEFCPCNANCLWEGEMILVFSANMDGVAMDSMIGSSGITSKLFVKEPYTLHFKDIQFEEACSNSIPSPKIVSATVRVSK